jgi:ribosomal-protein-alanine N-acetyltransferase
VPPLDRPLPIETPRLVLRPIELTDAPDVFAYAADPRVLRYTTAVTPTRVEETEAWLRNVLADAHTLMWAIRLTSSSTVIGAIELGMLSSVTASVHYALAQIHWGRGLMTEAVQAVSRWAFEAFPDLHEIATSVAKANPGSVRVLDKCGYVLFAAAEEHWPKESQPVPCLHFRLTRDMLVSRSAP